MVTDYVEQANIYEEAKKYGAYWVKQPKVETTKPELVQILHKNCLYWLKDTMQCQLCNTVFVFVKCTSNLLLSNTAKKI
jgi:hypothetical protein